MHESVTPALRDAGLPPRSRFYPWLVFALTFGLMVSDYASRQVIGAILPAIKSDWQLTDAQLGWLASIASLFVGLLVVPVSLLCDRWGRVKGITLMALTWCLATIACGLAANFPQLLVARGFVGLGEAAYASAGAAIVFQVFPQKQWATIGGAFISGGAFGSLLGLGLGGSIASRLDWHWAFIIIGTPGLFLALAYPLVVREYKAVALLKREPGSSAEGRKMRPLEVVHEIFATRSAGLTYLAGGLQVMLAGVVVVWMPSYLNRYYAMTTENAAILTAVVVLIIAIGTILGGGVADRLSATRLRNRPLAAAAYCVVSALLLSAGFGLANGPIGLLLILLGALLAGSHNGVASAIVGGATHPGVRTTVMATLVLSNSLLGWAAGSLAVGYLSDLVGLRWALAVMPAASLVAAGLFLSVARTYEDDFHRFKDIAVDSGGRAAMPGAA